MWWRLCSLYIEHLLTAATGMLWDIAPTGVSTVAHTTVSMASLPARRHGNTGRYILRGLTSLLLGSQPHAAMSSLLGTVTHGAPPNGESLYNRLKGVWKG